MEDPYLRAGRIQDVIAAITSTGSHINYIRSVKGWAYSLTGNEDAEKHWHEVFKEHPEFFRFDPNGEKVSLILRRQKPFYYEDVIDEDDIEGEDDKKTKRRKKVISEDELATLINVAINLHSKALEAKKDSRWWLIGLSSFLGALIAGIATNISGFLAFIKNLA